MASQPVSADVDFIMEDVNLEEYWRKTMERCSAVAGWKLEDNAEELSLATIQAKLQPKKPKTKKQEIADKAANAFFSTLTFVQRFASIISSAASTVSRDDALSQQADHRRFSVRPVNAQTPLALC